MSSDFEQVLSQTTTEQLAGDPIARKAFSVAFACSRGRERTSRCWRRVPASRRHQQSTSCRAVLI